jgi:hypothetical protein
LAITRSKHVQQRLFLFGFMLALALAIKALILTRFAAANDPRGSLFWHRAWLAATGAAILVVSTGWTSKVSWPDGDGPIYLLMTKSLVSDGDLDLRNNYARREYLEFFPEEKGGRIFGNPLAARERNTQAAIPEQRNTLNDVHGAELAWHDIALPLALVPGYALAGRLGALITLNLAAVAAAMAVFELALMLGSLAGAIYAWAFFLFSAPIVAFSGEAFPEILGAAVAAWAAVLAIRWDAGGSRRSLLGAGLLIAILPWVCVRYWVVGAGLSLGTLLAAVRKSRTDVGVSFLLLGVPVALSLVVFAWFDHVHFGTLIPNAGYVAVADKHPQFFRRPEIGLSGLLFDRAFGLFPVAPFFVAGGALLALRREWTRAAILVIPFACCLVFMSFSRFWFGGWTPPARYLVVALGLIAPACAIVLSNARSRWWLWALGAWSWAIGMCYVAVPLARFPSTIAFSRSGWGELAREAGADVSALFPTMLDPTPSELVKLFAWIAVAAIGAIASIRVAREHRRPGVESSVESERAPS